MIRFPDTLPWLLPGTVIAIVIGTILAGPVARRLGSRRIAAWLLLVSLGVIVAATLTPVDCPCPGGADGSLTCDMSRVGIASLQDLLSGNDIAENILMFLPLGFAIALLPASRARTALLVAALVLPIGIETIQLFAVPLHRACQGWDVADNLTGLAIGLAAGAVVAHLLPSARGGTGAPPGGG